MFVTVAICTWNRARLLDATLAALAKLAVPGDVDWELLVVDNASRDDTARVLGEHRARLPLRPLFEPVQGHSNARNRAVAEARGELLLWTDDDVLVDEQWLAAYAAAARADTTAAFFGGPVRPWFEADPPAWLVAALPVVESAFAVRDLGEQPRDFDAATLPFGANFAVRSDVQRRHRYDPSLGRVGSALLSGDECDVLRAILAAGGRGAWVPAARVRHFVGRERMTLDWLRAYYRGIGRTSVLGLRETGLGPAARCWRLANGVARASVKAARARLRRRTSPPADWVRDLRDASIHWGRVDALRGITS